MFQRAEDLCEYVFNWDEIPGEYDIRLKEFLNQIFGIDWVKTAKIEKIDDSKTIKVSTEKKFLLLKLCNEKKEVIVEIDDGRTDKLIARIENDVLKIYLRDNKIDERTRCRILVNSAVTFIGEGKFETAKDKLDNAISRFGEAGDRRRKSMAKAYQGIIQYHEGKHAEGKELVLQALKEHKQDGAKREKIYEALTLVWMTHGGKMPDRSSMFADANLPNEVREVIAKALIAI